MIDVGALPDPRLFPPAAGAAPADAHLHALARDALAAPTRQAADRADEAIRATLAAMLRGDGAALAALFASAPEVDVARHLWRQLEAAWRNGADAGALTLELFAIPVVVVAASESAAPTSHPGVLGDPGALDAILRKHRALGGSLAFSLSPALVGSSSIDLARLPELFAWQRLPVAPGAPPLPPRVLAPEPIRSSGPEERVHLRFLVGATLARADVDLLAARAAGPWGVPFTHELSRQLAVPDASVLALPRTPLRPLPAVAAGRAAQREVSAELFAGNAIRRLRGTAGEPTAVISAHRAEGAPGGGELRLSLSSPFAPRDAEGFRCPLYLQDRVGDVATMLVELLADCRVSDVRIAAGVHADRDPATGRTLLFKPDALPAEPRRRAPPARETRRVPPRGAGRGRRR